MPLLNRKEELEINTRKKTMRSLSGLGSQQEDDNTWHVLSAWREIGEGRVNYRSIGTVVVSLSSIIIN